MGLLGRHPVPDSPSAGPFQALGRRTVVGEGEEAGYRIHSGLVLGGNCRPGMEQAVEGGDQEVLTEPSDAADLADPAAVPEEEQDPVRPVRRP